MARALTARLLEAIARVHAFEEAAMRNFVLLALACSIPLLFFPVASSMAGEPPMMQLTFDPGFDASPTWSPDGARIAFTSGRNGLSNIWVIPAAGGQATRLSLIDDIQPDWSPDGAQIAFTSYRSGFSDIWVMPASGEPP